MADFGMNAKLTADISDLVAKLQLAAASPAVLSAAFVDFKESTIAANNAVIDSINTLSTQQATAMAKAADAAQESATQQEGAFSRIQESARALVEFLAILEGIHLFTEAVGEGARMGEELERLSAITGASIENLSRLKFAAAATGTDFSTVVAAIRRTSMELAQLGSGSGSKTLQKAMEDFKLSAKDLEDFPLTITRIADATEHMTAAAVRADATALLGRGGIELIPLIRNWKELGDRSDELGATLSGSVAEGAARAQESMNVLSAEWRAAQIRLASDLEPAIRSVISSLESLVHEVSTLAARGDIQRWAASAASAIRTVAGAIANELGVSSAAHIERLTANISIIDSNIREVKKDLASPWVIGSTEELTKKLQGYMSERAKMQGELISEQNLAVGTVVTPGETKQPSNLPTPSGAVGSAGGTARSAHAGAADAKRDLDRQFADFVSEQHLEAAEAGNTAVVKVAALTEVAQKAAELFGTQSRQYRTAMVEELAAAREVGKEIDRLATEQAAKDRERVNQWVRNWEKAGQEHLRIVQEAARTQERTAKTAADDVMHSLEGLIRGSETVAQGFERMGLSLAESLVGSAVTAGFKALFGLMLQTVTGDAATAAANTYAAVSAIPIIGPYLAPEAAAAAAAAVTALGGGIPSAAGGMVAPPSLGAAGMLTRVHSNEITLPAVLSQGFQRIIEAGGDGGGGDTHVHFNVTAVDRSGIERWFRNNESHIARTVSSAARNNRFGK